MRRRLLRALTALVVGFGLATGMLSVAAVPAHAAKFALSLTIADQTVTVRDTLTLSGKVSPKPKTRYVYVQRRYVGSTSWKTVKKVKTSASGTFRTTIGAGNDTDRYYRIYKPGQGSRKAGYSVSVQVIVDPAATASSAVTPIVLSPASGPLSGGTRLTISGSGLSGTTKVTFTPQVTAGQTKDGTGILPELPGELHQVSEQAVEVVTPASLGGANLVKVYTPTATLTGSYTFTRTARTADAFEQQVLDEINARRATPQTCQDNGTTRQLPAVPPVAMDEGLADLALAHSRDLAARQDVYKGLSHVTYGTSSFEVRFSRAEVTGRYGEILALTPAALGGSHVPAGYVVDQWMKSTTGHCGSLMSRNWTRAGVGVAAGVWQTKYGPQNSIFSNVDFS
jgi:uncharacterized protein YkwD